MAKTCPALAALYSHKAIEMYSKIPLTLNGKVQEQYCQGCGALLIPNVSCTTDIKPQAKVSLRRPTASGTPVPAKKAGTSPPGQLAQPCHVPGRTVAVTTQELLDFKRHQLRPTLGMDHRIRYKMSKVARSNAHDLVRKYVTYRCLRCSTTTAVPCAFRESKANWSVPIPSTAEGAMAAAPTLLASTEVPGMVESDTRPGVVETPATSQYMTTDPAAAFTRPNAPAATSNRPNAPAATSNRYNAPAAAFNRYNAPAAAFNRYNAPAATFNRYNAPAATFNRYNAPAAVNRAIPVVTGPTNHGPFTGRAPRAAMSYHRGPIVAHPHPYARIPTHPAARFYYPPPAAAPLAPKPRSNLERILVEKKGAAQPTGSRSLSDFLGSL
ncbi:hypothetical protein IWQ60_006286 [Tieghemiomyces parasiticus]|uniref:Uncharacterized protein n=1 Tax=Tieghemiomyces parasiticus TaxID=78921 RepID=A0A9W8ACI1_9FUNG|nr:hypothetical protein IWQ60_006286 [Tieghemiomyces parasiticus]